MKRSDITGSRLVFVFGLGCVLLNYPLLALVSGGRTVSGVPLLHAYVFAVWLVLIGLMAIVADRSGD